MDKPKIETITVEAAVARMINLGTLPSSATPFEITQIMHANAEEEYKKARGNTTKEHLRVLVLRGLACKERLLFTLYLQDALEYEVKDAEHSMIEVVDNSEGKPLLSVESVSRWAFLNFHMKITDWKFVQNSVKKVTNWQDCTIKIYHDCIIGLFKGIQDHSRHPFQDLGLIGKRKREPNKIGRLLIWLSMKKQISKFPEGITRKDISLLRDAMRKLTGLSGDPFYPLNEKDNYIPRFKIIDDTRNADERAKRQALHVEYEDSLDHDEARDFEDEDDEAGDLIRRLEDGYW